MLFNDLMVGYHDSMSFKELPKPFACVATDIVTGTPVVFHEGALPVALRASMAIPGAFTPVYTDNQVLIDGGMTNNFPTDVALSMGADVVIGVDVQAPLRGKDELTGSQALLSQIVEIAMGQHTWEHNKSLTDVYIPVDVTGYTSASFNLPALDTLIRRGAKAAKAKLDELEKIKEKIGISKNFVPEPHGPYLELSKRGRFRVYNVSFEGLKPREQKWVMRKCRISNNSEADIASLNRSMEILGATSSYSNIYYSLRDTLDGYNLDFHMQAIKGNSLSAGVEADTEEIAAALINGTFRFGKYIPMEVSLTGRLGKRLMAQADYTFLTSPLSGFRFGYTYRHNDIDVNLRGVRDFNLTYNHHLASFSFVNMNFLRQNLRLEAGIVYQNYFFHRRLVESQRAVLSEAPITVTDEQFVSYFGRVDFETIDSRMFTRRGTVLSAYVELFTDNFYQYKGHFPFSAVSLSWMTAFPLSKRFSLIPSLYGRVLFGNDIPFPMANVVGGKFFGRYMPQQMPFDGIGFMELAPHSFLAAKLQVRELIGRRHFVSASFNYGIADNSLLDIFKTGNHYFGASIDYGYNFRIIPVMASFTWSNITRSVGFYAQVGYMF
jgi:NTE family protein